MNMKEFGAFIGLLLITAAMAKLAMWSWDRECLLRELQLQAHRAELAEWEEVR